MEIINLKIDKIICASCGVVFFLSEGHKSNLVSNKKTFYCPNGHTQSYTGKSLEKQLEEEKAKCNRYSNYLDEQSKTINELQREKAKLKRELKKNVSK